MKYLLLGMSGLEISDGVITQLLVGNGLIQEGNPLMKSIVREGNFLLVKVVGVLLCLLILWKIYRHFPRLTLIAASSIVLFYGVVLTWNLGIFFGI